MKSDALNLSTDLLRICNWIIRGQDTLADNFLDRCLNDYQKLGDKTKKILIEIRSRIWGREKSAEQALTLSRILFYRRDVETTWLIDRSIDQ